MRIFLLVLSDVSVWLAMAFFSMGRRTARGAAQLSPATLTPTGGGGVSTTMTCQLEFNLAYNDSHQTLCTPAFVPLLAQIIHSGRASVHPLSPWMRIPLPTPALIPASTPK